MNKKQVIRLNENQLRRIVTESVKRILTEDYDFSKVDNLEDFTYNEILKLASILKENPIEEMWKPYDLGWCKVQRVEESQIGGRLSLLGKPHNISTSQDYYSKGLNGELFLQIGRMPNTNWHEKSGYTYMCWK